jgi:CheY-like chemotaxis protein
VALTGYGHEEDRQLALAAGFDHHLAKPIDKSGEYRLYSRTTDPRTGRRKTPGTFKTRAAPKKHERAVQYFKRR